MEINEEEYQKEHRVVSREWYDSAMTHARFGEEIKDLLLNSATVYRAPGQISLSLHPDIKAEANILKKYFCEDCDNKLQELIINGNTRTNKYE